MQLPVGHRYDANQVGHRPPCSSRSTGKRRRRWRSRAALLPLHLLHVCEHRRLHLPPWLCLRRLLAESDYGDTTQADNGDRDNGDNGDRDNPGDNGDRDNGGARQGRRKGLRTPSGQDQPAQRVGHRVADSLFESGIPPGRATKECMVLALLTEHTVGRDSETDFEHQVAKSHLLSRSVIELQTLCSRVGIAPGRATKECMVLALLAEHGFSLQQLEDQVRVDRLIADRRGGRARG